MNKTQLLCFILAMGIITLSNALREDLTQERYDRELLNQCTLNGYYELEKTVLRCELIHWREL